VLFKLYRCGCQNYTSVDLVGDLQPGGGDGDGDDDVAVFGSVMIVTPGV